MNDQRTGVKKGRILALCMAWALLFAAVLPGRVQAEEIKITPVTWEVSEDHLMIEGDEARNLYNSIKAGNYPSLEELQNNPIVQELDALSEYYNSLYSDTSLINTPEREKLRKEVLQKFLARGSARTAEVRADGSKVYVYDGPLKYEYQALLVLGLPASGKSTRIADPSSEALSAFNLDSDVMKEMLPEFQESRGAAASSVHKESQEMQNQAVKAFTEGKMKGCNIIIQTTGNNLDSLKQRYLEPFENAGYNVRVVLVDAEVNESLSRAVMRGLRTGRIIPSSSIIGYGEGPRQVYQAIAKTPNKKGLPYGLFESLPVQDNECVLVITGLRIAAAAVNP